MNRCLCARHRNRFSYLLVNPPAPRHGLSSRLVPPELLVPPKLPDIKTGDIISLTLYKSEVTIAG